VLAPGGRSLKKKARTPFCRARTGLFWIGGAE